MIRVAIGYDYLESAAFSVFAHSIQRRSSMSVDIIPVDLGNLKGILTRDRHPLQSTDFSFSRFLVPWMLNYEGWVIFADCDMLCRDDISKLWAMRSDTYDIMSVHHRHWPKEDKKHLGTKQTRYDRKNWSSLMLMNCSKLRILTPEFVNDVDGLDLHQFAFLEDEKIGWIPKQWNHLVGYDAYDPNASIVHFTSGGPYFKESESCDYADEWQAEFKHMVHVKNRSKLALIAEDSTNLTVISSEQ